MEFSLGQNRDVLTSNRLSMFVNATNNSILNHDDILVNENIRKIKSTPRKCKTNFSTQNDAKMKKSSSLHNIENLGVLIQNENEMIGTNTINKQQIYIKKDALSKIDKEKKFEGNISELTLKKEKEILLMENKRLTETVQNLQMDAGKMRIVIGGLKMKMRELGQEVDDEEIMSSEVMDASGDGGTGHSYTSLTQATVGDTHSVSSEEWPAVEDICVADTDFLKSLSVSTLQERIQKMEEDSYCTEEELQATMLELKDLQHNLDVLNDENRNLSFERAILLESLCEQTQKLQQCRFSIDNFKTLLINNSRDYPQLDAKLQELYSISEEENQALIARNDELRLMLENSQSDNNSLDEKLNTQKTKYSQLDEKYRDELLQRHQVETALKNHSELFGKTVDWTDCSSGVLTLIRQNKSQRQIESSLKTELSEKTITIDGLTAQIRTLEENMRLGMKHKEEHNCNIEHLQSQLLESEREIAMLNQTLDALVEKCADDTLAWRRYESDLLMSITAAFSLKEDRDRDLLEMEQQLEKSELARKQLQDKLQQESQKTSISSQAKDRVIATRDQNSLANTNSVKTLIQSLEFQMKPGTIAIKPNQIVTLTNHTNGTNTVPRSSVNVKAIKKEITRTNTVKNDISPSKHIPEITIQKSSSFKNETPPKTPVPSIESCQTSLQPLTTVVSQASSILQSVSRRNSVVTNPQLEHHSHYQSPTPSKPPSPPPTSSDPLANLVKKTNKGSKRNALLYWCQSRTSGYPKIDITNFSSSWNDGLALCALLHSFDSKLVDFLKLADATPANPDKSNKRINFQAAFSAAENLGIPSVLDIETMVNTERPAWNSVMNYVIEIYIHFECQQNQSEWAPPLSNRCHNVMQ